MENVADCAASGIVANEDKQPDLSYSEGAKTWVETVCRRFGPLSISFCHIVLKHQIDDGFGTLAFLIGFVLSISLFELVIDVLVHLTSVPPMYGLAYEVQVFEWIALGICLMPTHLTEHTISQGVISLLGSEMCVTVVSM